MDLDQATREVPLMYPDGTPIINGLSTRVDKIAQEIELDHPELNQYLINTAHVISFFQGVSNEDEIAIYAAFKDGLQDTLGKIYPNLNESELIELATIVENKLQDRYIQSQENA